VVVVPSSSSIGLSWGPSAGAAGYRVYFSPVNGMQADPFVEDTGNVTEFELLGLNAGWEYLVFVTAYNEDGVESDNSEPRRLTLYSWFGNNIPQFISRPVTVAKVDELYTYQLEAVDMDADNLTYSLLSGPDGMFVLETTGLIQWLPTETGLGNSLVKVEVTDGRGGRDEQAFYVNVSEEWDIVPPQITSRPPLEPILPENQFTYQLTAEDADGDTYQFAGLIMPAGMTIDNEGLIQWTPQVDQIGSHLVWLKVVDDDNMYDSQQFTLTVVSVIDRDLDGHADSTDNCPNTYNPDQLDSDSDSIGDACDTCPQVADVDQTDTDADGMGDLCETGCTDVADADSDEDGIIDGMEDVNRNGIVDDGETNPCNPDSDGDGAQDGTELGYTLADIGPDTDTGVFIPDNNPATTTDPDLADTEGDGMGDGWEMSHGLDPLINDAWNDDDGDGYLNIREARSNSDPKDGGDTPESITVYVNASNQPGDGNGSMIDPFGSLMKGLSFAGDGDTIQVADGYYPANLLIDKNIFLLAENPSMAIIDGSYNNSPTVHFTEVASGSIEGFDICYGTGAGIKIEQSTVLVKQNRISDTISYWDIEGDGIIIGAGSTATIMNNVIFNNALNGIFVEDTASANIVNNTISTNGWDGIGCYSGDGVEIKNNIVVENGIDGISAITTPEPTLSYNNVWNNAGWAYYECSAGIGDIVINPIFVDSAIFDFHLQNGSPCIDAGDPLSDYSDEPNPNGTRINMGAYGGTSEATITTDACLGDYEPDGDVDGSDLYNLIIGNLTVTIEEFAMNFGKTNCQ
jgi:parallel beta-helix repeat protein